MIGFVWLDDSSSLVDLSNFGDVPFQCPWSLQDSSHPELTGRGGHCERRVFCSVAEDGVSDWAMELGSIWVFDSQHEHSSLFDCLNIIFCS